MNDTQIQLMRDIVQQLDSQQKEIDILREHMVLMNANLAQTVQILQDLARFTKGQLLY